MITIQNTVEAAIDKVWNFWTLPEHITKWNTPSPDWHTPYAENDLRIGGSGIKITDSLNISPGGKTFMETEIDYKRQVDLFDPRHFNQSVVVIGLGNIGQRSDSCNSAQFPGNGRCFYRQVNLRPECCTHTGVCVWCAVQV